jgi:DNA repair exonuclease SbcCD ATPase subunit
LTGHIKKAFALSALIPLAVICSCQKQDSTAEQKLAQRKTELDAREKALDEREKALDEREKLVAKPRVPSVPRIAPALAEPQRTVPPELQGIIADPSQLRTAREQRMQERLAETQRKLDEMQRRRVRALPPNQTTAPSTEQAGSPSPSPMPEQFVRAI